MKISVCIDMMFSYLDFYDRFAAVKRAGIGGVEFWKWTNKDIPRVCEELRRNGLSCSIFNLDSREERLSADLSRGILNAGRKGELLQAMEESMPIYRSLDATGMILLIGETLDLPYEVQMENILSCLEAVKPVAEQNGVTLLLEPLNDYDRKHYFLPRSAEVLELIKKVNSPNIKLLLDIYHEQRMRGNIIGTIRENAAYIGHYHVADSPGRQEPGTGELNYPNILKAIRESGYSGYVGLEYRATRPDETTFEFLKEGTAQ